jgi:hypothetical protein
MKKTVRTLLLASLCLLLPATLCAQKKNTTKKAATTQTTYPQRDEAFKADYKLSAIGTFDPNNLESLQFTAMPAPDFTGHVLKLDKSRKQVKLKQLSCKQNGITDDDDWFFNNDLVRREERVELPMGQFAPRFRYRTGGYLITTYGENWGNTLKVTITDEAQQTLYAAYDFESYKFSPKTTLMGNTQSLDDFIIEGNILYFSFGTNSYSDGAGYQTGYIAAFDMEKQELIWVSQPLTCNSHFAVVDNSITCGYGFTSEPDNLFILDKYSGQRIQKLTLKKMALEVVPKNGYLYVRTYSYDYLFEIQ